jgi:HD superfamily phosphohydrolase YqeK
MHPVVERAGRTAELPSWARCGDARREHGKRVGDLLSEWACRLGRSEDERVLWRATGVLHDALKGAPEPELRALAGEDWPLPVVHAPACAARLAADGVRERSLLDAIRYHPVGHPDLDELGEYLILADYLEPGRNGEDGDRAELRGRLPEARAAVLTHVLRARLGRLLEADRELMQCTVDMWNRVVAR